MVSKRQILVGYQCKNGHQFKKPLRYRPKPRVHCSDCGELAEKKLFIKDRAAVQKFCDGIDEQTEAYSRKNTHHNIIPDIEPFKSPSGVYITSRKNWKEHLRETGCIEMAH